MSLKQVYRRATEKRSTRRDGNPFKERYSTGLFARPEAAVVWHQWSGHHTFVPLCVPLNKRASPPWICGIVAGPEAAYWLAARHQVRGRSRVQAGSYVATLRANRSANRRVHCQERSEGGRSTPRRTRPRPAFRREPHGRARSSQDSARKRSGGSVLRPGHVHHRWHHTGGAPVVGFDGKDRSAGRLHSSGGGASHS